MLKIVTRGLTRRSFLKLSSLAIGNVVLVGCGGAQSATNNLASKPTESATTQTESKPTQSAAPSKTPDPDETPEPTSDGKPTPTLPPGTVLLEIGTAAGANEFKYDKETLEAPAGSKIKLRFTNNTNYKDEVGHNWVLVKPGQEDSVVANGHSAGDAADWLYTKDPDIIAHTRLIEGNKTDTIIFDAPPPGTYTYLSTFPDQYAGGMKGTLTIK
jgi:azurin